MGDTPDLEKLIGHIKHLAKFASIAGLLGNHDLAGKGKFPSSRTHFRNKNANAKRRRLNEDGDFDEGFEVDEPGEGVLLNNEEEDAAAQAPPAEEEAADDDELRGPQSQAGQGARLGAPSVRIRPLSRNTYKTVTFRRRIPISFTNHPFNPTPDPPFQSTYFHCRRYETGFHVMPDKHLGFYVTNQDLCRVLGAPDAINIKNAGWTIDTLRFFQHQEKNGDWEVTPALQTNLEFFHDNEGTHTGVAELQMWDEGEMNWIRNLPNNWESMVNNTDFNEPWAYNNKQFIVPKLDSIITSQQDMDGSDQNAMYSDIAGMWEQNCLGKIYKHTIHENKHVISANDYKKQLKMNYAVNSGMMQLRSAFLQRNSANDGMTIVNWEYLNFQELRQQPWMNSYKGNPGQNDWSEVDKPPMPELLFKVAPLPNHLAGAEANVEIWAHGYMDTYCTITAEYATDVSHSRDAHYLRGLPNGGATLEGWNTISRRNTHRRQFARRAHNDAPGTYLTWPHQLNSAQVVYNSTGRNNVDGDHPPTNWQRAGEKDKPSGKKSVHKPNKL